MQQRRSHNTMQMIDTIISAADRLDPELTNRFFEIAFEATQAHYELISPTLSDFEKIRHQRMIVQGSIILSLFNHFAIRSENLPAEHQVKLN